MSTLETETSDTSPEPADIPRSSMLVAHATKELDLILGGDLDQYDDLIKSNVLDVVRLFASQGHSGASSEIASHLIGKLLRFEPLTPLTGEDGEWELIDQEITGQSEPMWQNKRCPRVFRNTDAAGHLTHAIVGHYVFEEPDGFRFTNGHSSKEISFPYTPEKPVYVSVDDRDRDGDDHHQYFKNVVATFEVSAGGSSDANDVAADTKQV